MNQKKYNIIFYIISGYPDPKYQIFTRYLNILVGSQSLMIINFKTNLKIIAFKVYFNF